MTGVMWSLNKRKKIKTMTTIGRVGGRRARQKLPPRFEIHLDSSFFGKIQIQKKTENLRIGVKKSEPPAKTAGTKSGWEAEEAPSGKLNDIQKKYRKIFDWVYGLLVSEKIENFKPS